MDRKCGTCDICCIVGAVPALNKPAHTPCRFACGGCAIYQSPERPEVCRTFRCAWLDGVGCEEDRPDRSGVLASVNRLEGEAFDFGVVIEWLPDAVRTRGRRMVVAFARSIPMPIIVADYGRNDAGRRVVVRNNLVKRTKRMRGKWMETLAHGVGLYALRRESD